MIAARGRRVEQRVGIAGPLGEHVEFGLAQRPVVVEGGTTIRGKPGRHVSGAGDQRDVVGDGGGVSGRVEGQGAPSRATGDVATDTVLFENRHHRFGERPTGELVGREVGLERVGGHRLGSDLGRHEVEYVLWKIEKEVEAFRRGRAPSDDFTLVGFKVQ